MPRGRVAAPTLDGGLLRNTREVSCMHGRTIVFCWIVACPRPELGAEMLGECMLVSTRRFQNNALWQISF